MGKIQRNIPDAQLLLSKALPAAGASNSSASLDLGPGYAEEEMEFLLTVPATPSLVDTKTVTVTLEDSADNVTFAAIPAFATAVQTGSGGAGGTAISRRLRVASDVRRYVRFSSAVQASGGDNTAIAVTLQPLF
ncbi:MAG: hypothetical protein JO317_06470 [Verrucomicrobiae bacterium]|nr:hypothetical protein [Verrucomicrobiae bacterium]